MASALMESAQCADAEHVHCKEQTACASGFRVLCSAYERKGRFALHDASTKEYL